MELPSPANKSRVCAILFPVSDAAHHSTGLPQNEANVQQLCQEAREARLPSPVYSEDNEVNVYDMNQLKAQTQEPATPSWGVILRQTADLHSFTFGAGLENFYVLQHDPVSSDHACYINLLHCQFYPDPESSDIWLKNSSTSVHSVKRRYLGSQASKIGYGESAPIHAGVWDLSLGHGLQFIVVVTSSSPPSSVATTNAVLTQTATKSRRSKKPSKRGTVDHKGQVASNPIAHQGGTGGDRPGRTHHKDEEASSKPLVPGSDNEVRVTITSEDGYRDAPALNPPVNRPPASDVIGVTPHSRVERRLRDGIYVAIKICRRPNIPEAADMWLQEVKMLRALDQHVCKATSTS